MSKKYYVVMTDKFMSGWGMSQGKTNKYVIECDNIEQAQLIYKNAKKRSEMKRINIRYTRPYYNQNTTLTTWKHYSDMGGMWLE